MGLEALLEVLERDALAEAGRIRAEARGAAEAMIARAGAEVDRRRALMQEKLSREHGSEVIRDAAAAARRRRGEVLTVRSELLDRVFVRSAEILMRSPPDRWSSRLPGLVARTLPYLDPDHAVLVCHPAVEPCLRRALADHPGVTIEPRSEMTPGLIGEDREGTVVIDNRLATTQDQLRGDLSIQLVARLEGKPV